MLNLKEMTREQLEYDICGMETVYQMNERKFKSWSLQQTLKAKNPDEAKML